MAIDWDGLVLSPVMTIFGEGDETDPSAWPLYTPQVGDPFRLACAVFDREYLDVQTNGEGSQISTQRPMLGVRLTLFPPPLGDLPVSPLQGDRVFIPSVGITYIVKEVRRDGHGEAKLMLQLIGPAVPVVP